MVRSLIQSLPRLLAPSDEQAMQRVQTVDDPAALVALIRRWEAPVRRLCERMTGDHHRAEDLAQEAFVRVFARRRDYEPNGKFSTFLWRIALNLCYDELRRRKRRLEFPIDGADDEPGATLESTVPPPSARLEEQERADHVRTALDRLPEHYRAVVVLRHYEGLKLREIAEVLAVPEGTVKSRMAEALDQLAVALKEFNSSAAPPAPRTKQIQLV